MFSRGYSGSGFALAHRLGWYLGRGVKGFVSQVRDSFHRGYRSSAATPRASNRPTGSKERPFLTLMLVVVPLAVVAAVGPPEWFLNWPTMFAGALLLVALLRGPLSGIHRIGKKIVKLGISICLLYGFWLLLNWKPLWGFLEPFGMTRNRAGFRLILVAIIVWWVTVFWIIFSRGTSKESSCRDRINPTLFRCNPHIPHRIRFPAIPQPQMSPRVPGLRFADVGGLEDEKQQIRDLVESRIQPGKYAKYGVVRNGILLYGPPGSGKTFLAEATAGEFGLPFRRVLASDLVSMWMGDTEKRIHAEFEDAADACTGTAIFR